MASRRTLLRTAAAGTAAALAAGRMAAPALAQGGAARTLRFVPQGNLASMDPIWGTSVLSRNAGLMVYDTLFGIGSDFQVRPQMAAAHAVSADGLTHTVTLRPGLRFHDGEPVRARDCIASIRRWSKRDVLGQRLDLLLNEMVAVSDERFTIALKRPWSGLTWALGKAGANICAIMPERIAQTDPFTQITEIVGSGPYRFLRDEWVAGSLAAFACNAAYQPREEAPDLLAGGKPVHFDRVEWRVMPDAATAAAALQNNEADWWEAPLPDLLPVLRGNRQIVVETINTFGAFGVLRFNHLNPPFDNPAVRRALFPAVDQEAFMQAAMGTDPALYQIPAGAFTPGTPLANDAGLEILSGPRDVEKARQLLRASGYRNERVVLLSATDLPNLQAMTEVAADVMRRVGFNVDLVAMDWGTQIQRRTNRGPVEQGGFSAFCTTWEGLDTSVPGSHQPLRGNGAGAWSGWPTSPRREALRDAWFEATDPAAEKRIAEALQQAVWEEAPFIPLGLQRPQQAYRRGITGVLKGGPSLFWNVRRG
ncbi:ABC transporter substrate-binding protein [Pseudoroseomonas sp. WGS1072]|uniref:ABC transporter substrate-binding protein n=1 Tax=Roseomonas sp. WGS1072 TaxID=3366816 RepID=UPI003BF3F18C